MLFSFLLELVFLEEPLFRLGIVSPGDSVSFGDSVSRRASASSNGFVLFRD